MPRLLVSVVLTIACTLLAAALIHRDATSAPTVPATSVFEASFAENDALLDHSVKVLSFDDVTLQEAVDVLADLTKVNFVINWKALEAEGTSPDEQNRFTLHLRNVTLRQALDSLTHHTDASGSVPTLGYYVENGVVFVTTEADASKVVVTAFIDLRPLIGDIRRNGARWWFGHAPPATHQEIVDEIVKYMVDTYLESDSGSSTAIREIEGILIVTQTPRNVRLLRRRVEQLRAAILYGAPPPATQPTTAPTQSSESE